MIEWMLAYPGYTTIIVVFALCIFDHIMIVFLGPSGSMNQMKRIRRKTAMPQMLAELSYSHDNE